MKRSNPATRVAAAIAIAVFAGSTLSSAIAAPADGAIDTTFGTNGRTVIGFDTLPASPIDLVLDTLVDSFNRIYLVGVVNTTDAQRIGIARLREDGSLDTNYGPDDVGLVVAPEQLGFALTGVSAAIDPSGRLLVGGTLTDSGNDDFAVCRFDIDGSLTAFPNGLQCVSVALDLGDTDDDVLRDIAVQADGKIVMVGSAKAAVNINQAAIARLDTSGNLDTTFNGTGKLAFTGGFAFNDFKLNAVAIAANGKIVAVGEGQSFPDTYSEPVAVRVLADGTPDPAFGLGGISRIPLDNRDARLRDVALAPGNNPAEDPRIIGAGEIETAQGSGVYDGLLAAFSGIIGDPESDFGTGGIQVDGNGESLTFNALAREDNGNLTVVGTIRANSNPSVTLDYYITRFLPDGTRDTANFNPGIGYQLVDFLQPGGNDIANAVAFQRDRIVIAGGSLITTGPPANLDFSVVALLRDRIFANGFDVN